MKLTNRSIVAVPDPSPGYSMNILCCCPTRIPTGNPLQDPCGIQKPLPLGNLSIITVKWSNELLRWRCLGLKLDSTYRVLESVLRFN